MNCEEFWNGMPELDREPAGQHAAAHLNGCPDCAALLNRQRALSGGLRSLAEDLRHIGAPAHLEARLAEAFRRESGLFRMARRHSWFSVVPRVMPWVTAAAAAIALALFLAPRHPTPKPRHSVQVSPGAVELATLQAPSEAVSDDDATDAREGFIALPNAAQVGPNEDVNVVRVEVPRSAMMSVGIDVSDDRATERVEADVMLGSDGLPRAVRFVDPGSY